MPTPLPPEHSRFQPGKSGNPGGKTSAQRLLEVENAEKATRIHGALLDQFVALIEGGVTLDLEANLLKLVKDAQDRGLGAPQQTLSGGDTPVTIIKRVIIDGPDDQDPEAV
jgi:hypothetical protein